MPPPQAITPAEPTGAQGDLTIPIRPIFGLSIPVVVRHGETFCKVSRADLAVQTPKLTGEPPRLALRILRDGNQSMSGILQAFWAPGNSKPILAGEFPTAIYHPLPFIRIAMPLDKLGGKVLAGGVLTVKFTPRDAKEPAARPALTCPRCRG